MGERVPTSYSQEPVVHGETTHKPSWSRSGGGGVDGDGSGGQSPSRQGVGTGTSNTRNLSAMAAALGTRGEKYEHHARVFGSGGIYGRKGEVGGAPRGPHHVLARLISLPREDQVTAPRSPTLSRVRLSGTFPMKKGLQKRNRPILRILLF